MEHKKCFKAQLKLTTIQAYTTSLFQYKCMHSHFLKCEIIIILSLFTHVTQKTE